VFARTSEWSDEGDSHLFAIRDAVTGDPHQELTQLTRLPRPATPIGTRARGARTTTKISPDGEAVALAVSRSVTAALIHTETGWRLDIYTPLRRSVVLAQTPTPALAASGPRVVLRSKRTIYVLDARRGAPRVVAHAGATPIGLSIVGRRIAWAENVGRRARVRAVTLSR
jgi:hypothetical protein